MDSLKDPGSYLDTLKKQAKSMYKEYVQRFYKEPVETTVKSSKKLPFSMTKINFHTVFQRKRPIPAYIDTGKNEKQRLLHHMIEASFNILVYTKGMFIA